MLCRFGRLSFALTAEGTAHLTRALIERVLWFIAPFNQTFAILKRLVLHEPCELLSSSPPVMGQRYVIIEHAWRTVC
jgi:hypothetical protein